VPSAHFYSGLNFKKLDCTGIFFFSKKPLALSSCYTLISPFTAHVAASTVLFSSFSRTHPFRDVSDPYCLRYFPATAVVSLQADIFTCISFLIDPLHTQMFTAFSPSIRLQAFALLPTHITVRAVLPPAFLLSLSIKLLCFFAQRY